MALPDSSISNFKKFLLKIVLPSLAIILPVAIGLSWYFEKHVIICNDYAGVAKINRIIKVNDSTETPIFGNSHVYNGLIPDSIGKNFFNYAIQGIGEDVVNFFLDEECKKKRTSPLIIADLNLEGFGTASEKFIKYYIPNAGNAGVKEILGKNYDTRLIIPVIKYFGYFEEYYRDYINTKNEKVTENKGSILLTVPLSLSEFNDRIEKRMNTNGAFRLRKDIVDRFFTIIKSNPNRFFFFVIVPVHKSLFNRYENYDDVEKLVNNLNTMPNVRVLNYCKANYPDSLFYHSVHLNVKGAARFSREVRDTLLNLKIPAITNSLKK